MSFLRDLLKDMPYVMFVYITGILPIAKYSSGSELNMFVEFTMAKSPAFSDYFGFTEDEVTELYNRYLTRCTKPHITRDGLRLWYNGYHTAAGERVYNPRSVVFALLYDNLANYWTSAGPYDEIYYYIEHNINDVKDDLALMVSGASVPAKIQEYAATSMNLQTKDEIFSAMVVYGFLSYEDGIILELKVDSTPEAAIQQIKDKKYALKFLGKIGEKQRYTGRVLAVGISYNRIEKKHHCKIEVLTDAKKV